MTKQKWSDSDPEGRLLARMLRYAKKIMIKLEKAMDGMEDWDNEANQEKIDKLFDKYTKLMHQVAIAGKAKKDIARSTDWEHRLKELEKAQALTPEMLALLEQHPPDSVTAKK